MSGLFIDSRFVPHEDDSSRHVIAAGKVERAVSETPAETIRRATTLMRRRGELVPPSPWFSAVHDVTTHDGLDVIASSGLTVRAQYVASWHPAVALAVAEWLEASAQAWDEGMEWDEALAVAGAYLNEDEASGIEAVRRAGLEAREKHHGGTP